MQTRYIIGIILIVQGLLSPLVMFKIRKYITDNISYTIKKYPSKYSRQAKNKYPKEVYAVLKNGDEILYDTPTIILSIQIFVLIIGVCILFT